MFYFQFGCEQNLFLCKTPTDKNFVSRFRYKMYVSFGRLNCVAVENYFGVLATFHVSMDVNKINVTRMICIGLFILLQYFCFSKQQFITFS